MSKKEYDKRPSLPGWIIFEWSIQSLEGKLLTLVESWGLKDTQEKAVKDLIRQEVWTLLNGATYITEKQVTDVEEQNKNIEKPLPK